MVQQQPSIFGFLDCFRVLGVIAFLGVPLAILIRKLRQGGGAAAHKTFQTFACIFCELETPEECMVAFVSSVFPISALSELFMSPVSETQSLCRAVRQAET
jgi:hypothetical protein